LKVFFATRLGWRPSEIEREALRDLWLIVDAWPSWDALRRGG